MVGVPRPLSAPVQADVPAVILAAGEGQRLRPASGGQPKPLVRLLGLTLLERALLNARDAGVRRFFVVVGYEAEAVTRHLALLRRRYGLNIQVVVSPLWSAGNGASALAVAPHLQEPFFLMMADHLVEPDILRTLLVQDDGRSPCLMAVDREVARIPDLEDATRVDLHNGRVRNLGKGLFPFNAVDVGVFLCRPPIFGALEASLRRGDGSLSGGLRLLARRGAVRGVDIGGRFWLDVDTPDALALARRALLARCGKGTGDGPVARWLNRPISRRLTRLLAETPLTPTAMSVASFLLALAGAGLLATGGYLWGVAGGLLAQLASVLDGVDGELARLKHRATPAGGWLDTLMDRYADTALAWGIAWGQLEAVGPALALAAGVVGTSGAFLFSYTRKEYLLRFGMPLRVGRLGRLLPLSRDVRIFLLSLAAVLGHPLEGLLAVGVLSHLAGLARLVEGLRRGIPASA